MKQYPSITKEIRHDLYIYSMVKFDGSLIRGEWNNKKGFYKFGTKHQLVDEKTMPFGRAIPLLRSKYEDDLSMVFKEQGWKDAICFFEYWGVDSFAGSHNFEKPMDITLIDVNPYKKGILLPTQFIKYFGHLDIPPVLYEGHITTQFFDQVKQSTLSGISLEGVVCKGNDNGQLVMFKIKTQAWLNKLKEYCKNNQQLYEQLV
jgi:hypothetical protein